MPKTVGNRVMTSIYLRPEVLEALRTLAASRDVAMAQLMREAMDDLLAKYDHAVPMRDRVPVADRQSRRPRRAPAKAK